jgi:hypothetical protein
MAGSAKIFPLMQKAHADAPVPAEYLPEGHTVQIVLPALLENVPKEHPLQSASAS